MNPVSIDCSLVEKFLAPVSYDQPRLIKAIQALYEGESKGKEYLGWMELPQRIDESLLTRIEKTAQRLRASCKKIVCIGIGGSYLGTEAVIEALTPSYPSRQKKGNPELLFAGNNLDEQYLRELLDLLGSKSFGIIYISKSGTTIEPAIAFRILRKKLIENVGQEKARSLIVAITDPRKGTLRTLAEQEGYETFEISPDVGGRFSVLSPVGLLPICTAGLNIRSLMNGAKQMATDLSSTATTPAHNQAARYAWLRYQLYQEEEKKIEILATDSPRLNSLSQWWKQLFAESEGKDGKGIFASTANFTTDLHSIGQWIQEGERSLFETFLHVEQVPTSSSLIIPDCSNNLDELNYLTGNAVKEINDKALLGTKVAHYEGGVPVITLSISGLNETTIGALLYFFQMSVAISGNLLNINPFDQPGVEAYKSNMFALLNKPGYEDQSQAFEKKYSKLLEQR